MDIQPGHACGLRELALFAGAGGGVLGGHLLGWRTICAVEWDPYAASVLVARQNDGILPPFPIWDDVQNFDGTRWRGRVDIVSGGFPCQDISVAGKGAGIDGERSGMWAHMARIIWEVRPRYAFIENSPMLTSRGLGRVLADLASLGFDAEWGTLSAADVGAPHKRDRIWILARNMGNADHDGQASTKISESAAQRVHKCQGRKEQAREFTGSSEQYAELANTTGERWERGCQPTSGGEGESERLCAESARGSGGDAMADTNSAKRTGLSSGKAAKIAILGSDGQYKGVANTNSKRREELHTPRITAGTERDGGGTNGAGRPIGWPLEPDVGRVVDGVAARVDRLKAIGNGQVSRVAAAAFLQLMERIGQ